VPYEPYESFPYLVLWRWDEAFWRHVHNTDNGATLNQWHRASLLGAWEKLTDEDRKAVERHKQRAYGTTPYFPLYGTNVEIRYRIINLKSEEEAEKWRSNQFFVPDLNAAYQRYLGAS
jgi:hypothetical protein